MNRRACSPRRGGRTDTAITRRRTCGRWRRSSSCGSCTWTWRPSGRCSGGSSHWMRPWRGRLAGLGGGPRRPGPGGGGVPGPPGRGGELCQTGPQALAGPAHAPAPACGPPLPAPGGDPEGPGAPAGGPLSHSPVAGPVVGPGAVRPALDTLAQPGAPCPQCGKRRPLLAGGLPLHRADVPAGAAAAALLGLDPGEMAPGAEGPGPGGGEAQPETGLPADLAPLRAGVWIPDPHLQPLPHVVLLPRLPGGGVSGVGPGPGPARPGGHPV